MQEEMISSLKEQNIQQSKFIKDLKYDIEQLKNQNVPQSKDAFDQFLIGEYFLYEEEEDNDYFQNGIFGSFIKAITMTYRGSTKPSCSITNLAEDDKTFFTTHVITILPLKKTVSSNSILEKT